MGSGVSSGFQPLQPRLVSPVFSIIDGQVGVTVRRIDDQLDHGPIIASGNAGRGFLGR